MTSFQPLPRGAVRLDWAPDWTPDWTLKDMLGITTVDRVRRDYQKAMRDYHKEQEKNADSSPHINLKKVIPGANTYGPGYTSEVIKSLRKYILYEIKAKDDGPKKFPVTKFEDFVAKNIVETLGQQTKETCHEFIHSLEDLKKQDNIDKLYELKSGTAFFGDRGPLHIENLTKGFKESYPELIQTIPGEAELPSTTISGGFSICCSSREKPRIQR